MPLKGDLSSLAKLKANLRDFPKTLAHNVAQRAAPALTDLTVEAFISDTNVYGDERPAGVAGNTLTLVKTGETRRTLRFVSNGTIVRCVLGRKYMKYLIGKYGVLPNGALPSRWSARLGEIVAQQKVTP